MNEEFKNQFVSLFMGDIVKSFSHKPWILMSKA
jgi:hypothetical protein